MWILGDVAPLSWALRKLELYVSFEIGFEGGGSFQLMDILFGVIIHHVIMHDIESGQAGLAGVLGTEMREGCKLKPFLQLSRYFSIVFKCL